MRYLLDTHAIIWYVWGAADLPTSVCATMDSERCAYSAASLWEIAIKQGIGKLDGDFSIPEIDSRCRMAGFQYLPMFPTHLERIKTLPDIHRDPFDRLLVAQAMEEGFAILTRDRMIPQYPVQTFWQTSNQ